MLIFAFFVLFLALASIADSRLCTYGCTLQYSLDQPFVIPDDTQCKYTSFVSCQATVTFDYRRIVRLWIKQSTFSCLAHFHQYGSCSKFPHVDCWNFSCWFRSFSRSKEFLEELTGEDAMCRMIFGRRPILFLGVRSIRFERNEMNKDQHLFIVRLISRENCFLWKNHRWIMWRTRWFEKVLSAFQLLIFLCSWTRTRCSKMGKWNLE